MWRNITRITHEGLPHWEQQAALVLIFLLVSSTSPTRADWLSRATEKEAFTGGNGRFALAIFNGAVTRHSGTNLVVSPYAVGRQLQMLAGGLGGATGQEIIHALAMDGLSQQAIDRNSASLRQCFSSSAGQVNLSVATGVWYPPGLNLKMEFVARCTGLYDSAVNALGPTTQQSLGSIGEWADRCTPGHTHALAPDRPSLSNALWLASAASFKGKWDAACHPVRTGRRPFSLADGRHVLVPMVRCRGFFRYAQFARFQVLELPYDGLDFTMHCVIPDHKSTLPDLLCELSRSPCESPIFGGFRTPSEAGPSARLYGEISFPCLEVGCTLEMAPLLEDLGVKRVFRAGGISTLCDSPVSIGTVCHSALVIVDDSGQDPGPSWYAETEPEGPFPTQFATVIDRPFFFVIKSRNQEAILFIGVVYDPTVTIKRKAVTH